MKQYRIYTGTVTYAIKGRDLLRDNGYKVYIERISSAKSGRGCGYALNIAGDIKTAENLLKSKEIKILEIEEI